MCDSKYLPNIFSIFILISIGIATLGLITIWTGSAKAAEWKESGEKTASTLNFEGEKDSSEWTLDSEVLGGTIAVTCNQLKVSEGSLFVEGTALAKLGFSECSTKLAGSASMACLPKEPIEASVKVEQFLHEGEAFLLLSPDNAGLRFTEIKFDKEAGCAFGPNIEITGHVIAEDAAHELKVEKSKHLLQQTSSSIVLAGHENKLKFGAKKAQILGSEWLRLSTGNQWSGKPAGEGNSWSGHV